MPQDLPIATGFLVRSKSARLGFFDDVQEQFREVTVQHILVQDAEVANEIYSSIEAEGATADVVGRFAAAKSTCGSAKKRPNAKLKQLRGQPGELSFRRGAMAREFEQAAFAGSPGSLLKPVRTQFGWHIIRIGDDSPPPPNAAARASADPKMMVSRSNEPASGGGTTASLTSLAERAADAMRAGRAHIEPGFLSGAELNGARADMSAVFAQLASQASGAAEGGEENDGEAEFRSLQTDLLHPDFRSQPGLPFGPLLGRFEQLRVDLSAACGRSLLEGGGLHLMRYPIGSKFMRHVDEDPTLFEPERNSISFLLYLTPDDWSEADGGELRIYERGGGPCADGEAQAEAAEEEEGDQSGEEEARRVVLPSAGTLVIYDSRLEHEVLRTARERDLLSGRFREANEDWEARLRREAETVSS